MQNINNYRVNNFNAKSGGLTFLLCFAYSLVIGMLFSEVLEVDHFLIDMLSFVLSFVIYVLAILTVVKKDKINFKKAIDIKTTTKGYLYVIGIVLVIVLVLLFSQFNAMFEFLIYKTGYKFKPDPLVIDEWWKLLLSIITIALLPGVIEEIIFRGIIYKGAREISETSAIIFSSVLFSLLHGGIFQIIYQFVLGLVFVFAYKFTKDLKLGMAMHFANNAFILLYIYMFGEGESLASLSWGHALLSIGLLIVAAALVAGFYFLLKKHNNKVGNQPLVQDEADYKSNKKAVKEKPNKNYLIISLCIVIVYFLINFIGGYFIQ